MAVSGFYLERDLDDSLGLLIEMRNRVRVVGGEEKKNVFCSVFGRRLVGVLEGVVVDSDLRVFREFLACGSLRRCDYL